MNDTSNPQGISGKMVQAGTTTLASLGKGKSSNE